MELFHHSAAVHIPLALAVLFPPIYILFWFLIQRRNWPHKSWLFLLGLAFVQLVTNCLAYFTGWHDRTLSSASIELLDRHQDLAWRFELAWIFVALILAPAFLVRGKISWIFHGLLLLALLFQLICAVQLGHLGGQLAFGN